VRGDTVDVFPASMHDKAVRVEFFGDEIDRVSLINVITGEVTENLTYYPIYPATHYATSDEMREKCRSALEKLIKAAKESGANAYIYVRPPYGYSSFGYTPLEQCDEFDKLFLEISEKEGAENIYVNRAFAEAIKTTDLKLWGPDNAHTSEQGAYLAVCIFFATIFKKSATILDTNGLPENEVDEIKKIADKISSEVKR
jgi:transcription-repair coupling factor (superfamily II helicase)